MSVPNLASHIGLDCYLCVCRHKWDLGEFYQKETIATRWGTREELVRAVATAKTHGIDVLIDAVLNVRFF